MIAEQNFDRDYPFSKLDEIIEVRLKPLQQASPEVQSGMSELLAAFTGEVEYVLKRLKADTFLLLSRKKVEFIVAAYLDAIRILQQQATVQLTLCKAATPLADALDAMLAELSSMQARIELRYARFLPAVQQEQAHGSTLTDPLYKVLVKLSVDQIAIILKAADDAKVLVAQSLSLVFRSIMPFLSTDKTKQISWKSARSSTYKFEEHDKAIAIETLQNLIGRIKEF